MIIGEYMVIEVEYYKGNTLLHGKKIPFRVLKHQIDVIENIYDREEDNFVELLCWMYNWTAGGEEAEVVYVYDRDIERIIDRGHGKKDIR